jgi:trk system potassium uptake protein TrkH
MRLTPALVTVLLFLGMIVVGAGVLYAFGLPAGRSHSAMEAAFTSVSAVCVTGLSIVDLSRDMGTRGQVLVLVLLQIGGLGVLTLSNWVLLSLRGHLGVHGSRSTRESFGGLPQLSPAGFLSRVVLFTVVAEGLGTLALYLRFQADFAPGRALWLACFHSISAFCNAGFSLFSTSLEGYHADPAVNLTIMALIVLGGLGFVAAVDVVEFVRDRLLRRARRRLAFHTRLVLVTSGILILVGTVLFLALDWRTTVSFLSVTSRTAGFNTVATGHLTNMSLIVLMLLMVVGASPGSTGGGVKTTTLAIVWARTRSQLANRPDNELLGWSVPRSTAAKAMALLVVYVVIACVAMLALQATEFGELPHDQTRGLFLEHAFEVVSALSTVGLSTGITGQLSDAGLWVLMVCMFAGRVGPLVLAASLIGERKRLPFTRPEADVMVG